MQTLKIVIKITGYIKNGKLCTHNFQTVRPKYNVPEKETNIRRRPIIKVYFLTSTQLQKGKY